MKLIIALIAAFCAVQTLFLLMTALLKCRDSAKIKLTEDRLELKIERKSFIPRHYFVKILLKNLYTGEQIFIKTGRIFSLKSGISYAAATENLRCGVISAEITEAKFGIFTLAFRKKTALNASDTLLILPKISDFGLQNPPLSGDESLEKRSTIGSPDGAREYQNGDRLGDIHMKLSAKSGKYMVRERFGDGDNTLKIAFFYDENPEIAEKNAQLLLDLTLNSLANGQPCRIFCGQKTVDILGKWEIESGFFEIFSCRSGDFSPLESVNLEISGGEVRTL